MKIIEQSHTWIKEPDPIKLIELAGKTCYKSEDKITEDSANKFVKMLTKSGHLSVLEHGQAAFEVESYIFGHIGRTPHSQFIRRSQVGGRTIISANFRAWEEFFEAYYSSYGNNALHPIQALNQNLCSRYPDVFTRLWYSNPTDSFFRHITEDLMTSEEKLIHATRTCRFITNRGVTHELVRHRPWAYCLSGNTKILRFNQSRDHLTIKELYKRQQDGQLRGRNKLMLLRSMNDDNKIVPNGFKRVMYSGIKDTYTVKTSRGYEIKTSLDHVYFTPKGEIKLRDLKVGDELFVNGIDLIKDKMWLAAQRNNNLSNTEIAERAGVAYSTVRKYLKRFGLTKPIGYKPEGFTPWNKGLSENDDPRVKSQADALRENHHDNQPGELNSRWKKEGCESISGKRLRFTKHLKTHCEYCGSKENLENHHRDHNPDNWKESNKITLCLGCHHLYHQGVSVKHVSIDTITNIEYFGKEDVYDIEMNDPFHNFVADGFIVHNSQESTRYVKYDGEMEFILPVWGSKNMLNTWKYCHDIKNSRDAGVILFAEQHMLKNQLHSELTYQALLQEGWKPEQAREVLPNSLKTEIVCTAPLAEWKHMLKLRTNKAAHPQIRALMKPVLSDLKKELPDLF